MATDATGQGEGQAAAARRDDTRPDAAWKNIQKSAFCRWANEHLKSADLEITELETDLGDGIRLIRLAEALAGEKITQRYNARPTNRTQKLENITMCLQFLERQQKVRIVNIDSGDIVDGNSKLILGLMWTLILHYSISMTSHQLSSRNAAAADKPSSSTTRQSPKQQLLAWINQHLTDRRVTNFTSDWKDGKTLAALVNSLAPGQCSDWRSWDEQNTALNTDRAMKAATASLNIAPLITAEEMCDPRIDELSIMTYLSQFPYAKLNEESVVQVQEVAPVAAAAPEQSTTDTDEHKDTDEEKEKENDNEKENEQEKEKDKQVDDGEARKSAFIQAYGDGLATGYVGHPAKFTVTNVDRTKPPPMQVNIEGPSRARVGHRETDEGYEFTYLVAAEGEYSLSVVCSEDDTHIPGSPFRPKFTPLKNSYKVRVHTGDVFGAGTDANVYIIFVGEISETGRMVLKSSKTHLNKFERGNIDEFFVEVDNIGELRNIRMGHDNAGGPGGPWHLDRVEIELPLMHRKWSFPHSRWISREKEHDGGNLEHELFPDNVEPLLP